MIGSEVPTETGNIKPVGRIPEGTMICNLEVRPGDGVFVKVTVPAKPFTAATVTVEVGDWPALTPEGDVAATVKSWNRRTAVAECDREPLEPVIVSV